MMLDTSGLLCMNDVADTRHEKALRLFTTPNLRRVTHNYMLAEYVPLSTVRGLKRADAFSFLIDLMANPSVTMIWVDESLHRRAVELLLARPDKACSLCDAVSFILMRDLNSTDALTTDRHFMQEGFVRLL